MHSARQAPKDKKIPGGLPGTGPRLSALEEAVQVAHEDVPQPAQLLVSGHIQLRPQPPLPKELHLPPRSRGNIREYISLLPAAPVKELASDLISVGAATRCRHLMRITSDAFQTSKRELSVVLLRHTYSCRYTEYSVTVASGPMLRCFGKASNENRKTAALVGTGLQGR